MKKNNNSLLGAFADLIFAIAVFLEALKNADLNAKLLNIVRTLKNEMKLTIRVDFWLPIIPILVFFFWLLTSYIPLNKGLVLFSAVL